MTTFKNSPSISPIPVARGARTAPPAARGTRIVSSPSTISTGPSSETTSAIDASDRKLHQDRLEHVEPVPIPTVSSLGKLPTVNPELEGWQTARGRTELFGGWMAHWLRSRH